MQCNSLMFSSQLSSLLLGIHDPFVPFENLFCAIFLGGIWDSLAQTLAGKRAAAAEKGGDAAKNGNGKNKKD